MSTSLLVLVGSLGIGLILSLGVAVGVHLYLSRRSRSQVLSNLQKMVVAQATAPESQGAREKLRKIKEAQLAAVAAAEYVPEKQDIRAKLVRAQMEDPESYVRFRIALIVSCVCGVTLGMLVFFLFPNLPFAIRVSCLLFGPFAGYAVPFSWLERRIRAVQEELSYHLPLVIEEIAIGVTSGLDMWPCITNILDMVDVRDSNNPVTILFHQAATYVRSGLDVKEALTEVGRRSGSLPIKHTFAFLNQVIEHGGDIGKNLQDMADATMMQRNTDVEKKITALPVKATGPLCTVFGGFFALMLAGLAVQLLQAFPEKIEKTDQPASVESSSSSQPR